MKYVEVDDIDNIYNIFIDHQSLDHPYTYTVREVQNNIYHTVDSDKYIAFNTQSKNYINAYKSNNSDIITINHYCLIKWRSNFHTDMYVVGSKTNRKYELICSGNLNYRIPFTPTENKSFFNINDMKLKLEKSGDDFIFTANSHKGIYSRYDFETKGFSYNIFSLNLQNKINNIDIID